jgi:hypothetical protein
MDEIFLIESCTKWQCIQGDQTHNAKENRQHNFLGPLVAFFLAITSSRLAANIWSDRYK